MSNSHTDPVVHLDTFIGKFERLMSSLEGFAIIGLRTQQVTIDKTGI